MRGYESDALVRCDFNRKLFISYRRILISYSRILFPNQQSSFKCKTQITARTSHVYLLLATLVPRSENHGTTPDFGSDTSHQCCSRSQVRPFCLNGWGRSFRQTIIVGPYATPDANGLFREECRSLQGRVVSALQHSTTHTHNE